MRISHFFLSILLSVGFNSMGQSISLEKLLNKTDCRDTVCFDTCFTSAAYVFSERYNQEEGTYYRYISSAIYPASDNAAISAKNEISYFRFKNGEALIDFTTLDQNQYKSIQDELPKQKFVYWKTVTEQGVGDIRHYHSESWPGIVLTLREYVLTKSSGDRWTRYALSIQKVN